MKEKFKKILKNCSENLSEILLFILIIIRMIRKHIILTNSFDLKKNYVYSWISVA